MQEIAFVKRVQAAGGAVYVVGGWVRDRLRGVCPKDKDYVVVGMTAEKFTALFPKAQCVGRSFPVFLLPLEDTLAEIALARREKKQGTGYRGFSVEADGNVTIEEDLFRRDTTMNSMAMELPAGTLIDPYGGQKDIAHRLIRAVSPHFTEDPVRALRAARQAATFGFSVAPETILSMTACREELCREPGERILEELTRALSAPRPSKFFRVLCRANLLSAVFPEMYDLIGKSQPVFFHPEGDAFEHTMALVDAVAAESDDVVTRFAALVHDLGKGTTPPAMLPHHYGHEERGLAVFDAWGKRLPFPRRWRDTARFVIAEHMRAPRLTKPGKIVRLLLALDRLPIGAGNFSLIIKKDHGSLPPYLAHVSAYLRLLLSVRGTKAPRRLSGQAVGQWIFERRVRAYQLAAERGMSGDLVPLDKDSCPLYL
ncbi:MAG: HD domain-containing protein [Schwartzia sp. (in: firmicutes)]